MSRTITVNGTGKRSVQPDQTILNLSLKNLEKEYEEAVAKASGDLTVLLEALANLGFTEEELKTTNFNVTTEYENKREPDGNYTRVFAGYAVYHQLKLTFDFDTDRLAKAIGAIAGCVANPDLTIQFAVKDKETVSAEVLEDACRNARAKAEILASASGVTLSTLLSVNYSVPDFPMTSPTRFAMADNCMLKASAAPGVNIRPDDIEVSDSVVMVWEIR